jgi:hypothetical protein
MSLPTPTEVLSGIGTIAITTAWVWEKFFPKQAKTNGHITTKDHAEICRNLWEEHKIQRAEDKGSTDRAIETLFAKIDKTREETSSRLDKLFELMSGLK